MGTRKAGLRDRSQEATIGGWLIRHAERYVLWLYQKTLSEDLPLSRSRCALLFEGGYASLSQEAVRVFIDDMQLVYGLIFT
jgi:hypothetical protein